MGYMVEITENKLDKMTECVEDMLLAGGELMHVLEKMRGGHGYGHRDSGRGGRSMMGNRGGINYRDDDDDWDDDEMMAERRRRSRRTGRYI